MAVSRIRVCSTSPPPRRTRKEAALERRKQQDKQPVYESRWSPCVLAIESPCERSPENCEQSAFEQKIVPLVLQEDCADGDEREVHRPAPKR